MWIHFNNNPTSRNVGDCSVRAVLMNVADQWREIVLMHVIAVAGTVETPMSVATADVQEQVWREDIPATRIWSWSCVSLWKTHRMKRQEWSSKDLFLKLKACNDSP